MSEGQENDNMTTERPTDNDSEQEIKEQERLDKALGRDDLEFRPRTAPRGRTSQEIANDYKGRRELGLRLSDEPEKPQDRKPRTVPQPSHPRVISKRGGIIKVNFHRGQAGD